MSEELPLAWVAYGPSPAVTQSSTSSSTPTVLDTSNLRASFTAPASGKVWVLYGCMMLDSPASGLLCLAQGSSVVSQTVVAAGPNFTGGPTTIVPYTFVLNNDSISGLSGTVDLDLAVMGYSGTNVTAGYGSGANAYGCAFIGVWAR